MSLTSLLPAPKGHFTREHTSSRATYASGPRRAEPARDIPPYGARRGFVPSELADYGDGGAYPELPMLQYPLNMGRASGSRALTTRQGTTSMQLDAEGNTKYDAVIRQNIRKGQKVFTSPMDLVERDFEETDLRRPTPKSEEETTEATRLALEKLVEGKIASARPRMLPNGGSKKEPQYFRYTPGQQGAAYNSGAESRIIRLHEMPTDPLEPPKYKHKKVAEGPPDAPVPVMQSPPRKITVKDQKFWKIPPCVSNWKNIKGYTIPLDKRLASDGRHLQEKSINPAFARLSESLVVAERAAREEVEERLRLRTRLGKQKKQARERELTEKAKKARDAAAATSKRESEAIDDVETQEQAEKRMTRDQIREERKRDRQRELRMSERDKKRRKNVQDRNRDRDVSEKIALGQQVQRKEATYDQRLFNQSEGMDSGFRSEDAYDVYDKPLFTSVQASIYNPKKNVDADIYGDDGEGGESLLDDGKTSRKFKADREFEGVSEVRGEGPRNAPVQFEKDDRQDDEFDLEGVANRAEQEQRDRHGGGRDRDRRSGRDRDRDDDRRRDRDRDDRRRGGDRDGDGDRDRRSRRSRHQSRERSQAREELRRRRREERRRDFSRSRSRSPVRRR